jgi:hypothetical protein
VTDGSVIGIKHNGNKRKPEERASQLYAEKILSVTEEKALE